MLPCLLISAVALAASCCCWQAGTALLLLLLPLLLALSTCPPLVANPMLWGMGWRTPPRAVAGVQDLGCVAAWAV